MVVPQKMVLTAILRPGEVVAPADASQCYADDLIGAKVGADGLRAVHLFAPPSRLTV